MALDPNVMRRLNQAVESLPEGLRDHVRRVEAEALRLADKHGVDPERARVAALGHDLARAAGPDELLSLAAAWGPEPDDVERAAPILLHGPLSAYILRNHYHVDDEEVLAAAAWHTTARAGMSKLEKLLFIADKVEDDKVARQPGWRAVKELSETDLDAAVLRFLDVHIGRCLETGWRIHPRSVAARNELLGERPSP